MKFAWMMMAASGFFAVPIAQALEWFDVSTNGNKTVEVNGLPWFEENGGQFIRLPLDRQIDIENGTDLNVWGNGLYPSTARVRFKTDSTSLHLKIDHGGSSLAMWHMASIGVSGIDLYIGEPGNESFWKVTRPLSGEYEHVFFDGMSSEIREFTLYLPTYAKLTTLEIGIDAGATLSKPTPYNQIKPIVVYGTSITQGACSSRCSNGFVAQIGRRLSCDVVNLGFSGSGRCEPIMAEMMLEIDASIYIIDCLANMDTTLMNSRYEIFVNLLRAAKPDVPIILMTKNHLAPEIVSGSSFYDAQHEALYTTYSNRLAAGDNQIYLFDTGALIPVGGDHPSADGTHLTDEGFTRIADGLTPLVEEAFARNSGANTTNALPYEEPFESYANGFQMPGTNGWSGKYFSDAVVTADTALIAALTNYSAPCSYPLPAANHAKVLEVNGTVTNRFSMASNQIVWVDCMSMPVRGSLPPDTNMLAGLQATVGFNPDGHPSVWHYDIGGGSNRWAVMDNITVPAGSWVRLTFKLDYQTDDPVNSKRYFQVSVDGTLLTNERAKTSNDGSGSAGGSWFAMSFEPDSFGQVACQTEGRGAATALDDLVVTTDNPLTTSAGVPFEWLTSYDLTNETFAEEALLDADGDGLATWEEWAGDTNPTNGSSVLQITNMTVSGSGMQVYWQGGVQATQWLERSVNLVTGSWVLLVTNNPPTPIFSKFVDSGATNPVGFYRIKARR